MIGWLGAADLGEGNGATGEEARLLLTSAGEEARLLLTSAGTDAFALKPGRNSVSSAGKHHVGEWKVKQRR